MKPKNTLKIEKQERPNWRSFNKCSLHGSTRDERVINAVGYLEKDMTQPQVPMAVLAPKTPISVKKGRKKQKKNSTT